jgi:hypothetical protein
MTVVPGTALAAWELVGKQQQQESRLAIQLLQSLYDRKPIWERYVGGSLEIHGHVTVGGINLCACFVVALENSSLGQGHKSIEGEVHLYRDKFPMLVGVGEVTQNARPLASTVRLKLANYCGVFVADTFQSGRPMRREALLRILDGKLRAALTGSGVVLGENVDQVVQRRAEVVDDLSNQDARTITKWIKDPLA